MADINSPIYDYIIVGAGSAGCVLANRLTEDPDVQVLLLEAGPKDSSMWIDIPAGFTKLLNHPAHNWNFETEPEDNVNQRRIPIPRGRGLGGSSSINGMLYVRGQPLDYDVWAQRGNRGWSYDDVLPYFKKSERFEGNSDESRGQSGPLGVANMIHEHEICDAFIEAGASLGYPRNADYNNGDQEGFGYYQVTQRNGKRHSTARAFLDTAKRRHNLRVETNAMTSRVSFEGLRATGVEYYREGRPRFARAAREVLLCCGAVQSPQLLELSGIGQPRLLREHGIDVVHALPGVGENYGDHFAPRLNWRVSKPITLNEESRGWKLGKAILQYYLQRKGILTLTAGVAFGFVRTRPELETPDMQFHFAPASFATAATRELDTEPGMTITIGQCRPESRGSIHIRSANPDDKPVIRPNFLADPLDQACTVAGMKLARAVIEQPPMDAYRSFEMNPGSEVQSDDEWLDFARRNGQTTYHVIGTCKMGQDPMAVVDDRLRVRGVSGLRVVDASIMPTVPSGNTNAPTIMVAEKGADMIREDHAAK